MSDSIPKQVWQGLRDVGEETGKELLEQTGKIAEAVIGGKELLGNIKPMTEAELAENKQKEEKKKQEEMAKLRAQMGQGRKVEEEMEQIWKQKEEEERKKLQAETQQQRQAMAAAETSNVAVMTAESSNPSKQRKSRGSAYAGGKRKKQQPDIQSMSETNEFKGKID